MQVHRQLRGVVVAPVIDVEAHDRAPRAVVVQLIDVKTRHHRRGVGQQRGTGEPYRRARVDEAVESVQQHHTGQVRPVCVEVEKLVGIQGHPSILTPHGRTCAEVWFSTPEPTPDRGHSRAGPT